MSSTPSIQSDEPPREGTDRRGADAAVTHDDSGDAVPGRGCEEIIPGGLAVIVAMNVDPSRRHQESGGFEDRASGVREIGPDGNDAIALDRVRLLARAAPLSRRRSFRFGSTDRACAAPWSPLGGKADLLGSAAVAHPLLRQFTFCLTKRITYARWQ